MTFAEAARKVPSSSLASGGRTTIPGRRFVSMEKEVADGLGLRVGDMVVVNVLGRDIAAKVANLRKVNWRSFAINFVLVYSPNTLKGAPYTELVSAALPPGVRTGSRDRAPARGGPPLSLRRQHPRARGAGKRRSFGRQARACRSGGDWGRADDVGPGAGRGAGGRSPRTTCRCDHSEDPRRHARTSAGRGPDR